MGGVGPIISQSLGKDFGIVLPPEVALKRLGMKLPWPGQVDTSGQACTDYKALVSRSRTIGVTSMLAQRVACWLGRFIGISPEVVANM